MAVKQRWPAYRGWWYTRIVLKVGFGTCPTGWHIEGDLPNQVDVLKMSFAIREGTLFITGEHCSHLAFSLIKFMCGHNRIS